MGLFDIFRQKDARANHDFDNEDRGLSLRLRQQKAALKEKQLELETANLELKSELERTKLEIDLEKTKLQLDDLRGIEEEEDTPEGSAIDKMFMLFMTQLMNKNNTPVSAPVSSVTEYPSLTQEQMQEFWDRIPKNQQKQIKRLSITQLDNAVSTYIPNLTDKDKDKVREFIKAQK
jgi:hypothetical protein